MIYLAWVDYIYSTTLIRILRFFTIFFLFWNMFSTSFEPKAVFFLLLIITWEIFFHFKIDRVQASVPGAFTMPALALFISNNTSGLIKELLDKNSINFLLQKSAIDKKEIQFIDIDKKIISESSSSLVKQLGGRFVTSIDLFAAYLIASENQTKLLFNKHLKEEEFLQIVKWTREKFREEENPTLTRVKFWGEGFGEALTFGWTQETRKYTNDITDQTLSKKSFSIGRDTEYKELVEALSKSENNNVLLVGESGVGKDALLKSLAYNSFSNTVPKNLKHKRILELMLGPLIAGTTNQQEMETRVQSIIDEVIHSGNIILFIPEFQTIVNSSQNTLNITAILMPYLKKGRLPIIATITPSLYKQFIEGKPISDMFSVVRLEEPDKNTALKMLLAKTEEIEKEEKIIISFKAITTALTFANTYSNDKFLPGSAVLLLQDSVKSVSSLGRKIVLEDDVLAKIQEKTKISVVSPSAEEKDLLLHLEDKLHEHIIDQVEAVSAISEALRRIRAGVGSKNKPISFLFLGPTGVGKTETAKAISKIYFKGEENMIRLDMSEYSDEGGVKRLLGAMPGEGEERGELTEKIHDHPFSLVLLDEFEKANPKILDLFLQVFEDGRLTDNKGKTVSFNSSMIIATSNAASEFIRESIQKGVVVDKAFQQSLLEFLQTKELFKSELLNRFDEIIVFKPLGEKEVWEITKLLLNNVVQKLSEQDITVSFDEKIIQKIVREGFDQQFGARPLRRFIQDTIEDMIAQKILKGEIQRGNKINVSVDADNSIQITRTS